MHLKCFGSHLYVYGGDGGILGIENNLCMFNGPEKIRKLIDDSALHKKGVKGCIALSF